jgi:hypothetical protein
MQLITQHPGEPWLKRIARKCYYSIMHRHDNWSIGLYTGLDPFSLKADPQVKNPVIAAADVSDFKADFVADPFLIRGDDAWYMFVEVLDRTTQLGVISYASSPDGLNWTYQKEVLRENFHLSYPFVFQWQGDHYMVPETGQANAIRLYKAKQFPDQWEFVQTLVEGDHFVDATPFEHEGRWWMFAAHSPEWDHLRLFMAESPLGPWQEHPSSPVLSGDMSVSRPGGRVIALNNCLYRLAQDCTGSYGRQLHLREITSLTPTHYAERPALDRALLTGSGQGWNRGGMHHLDAQLNQSDRTPAGSWIAVVDGKAPTSRLRWNPWAAS